MPTYHPSAIAQFERQVDYFIREFRELADLLERAKAVNTVNLIDGEDIKFPHSKAAANIVRLVQSANTQLPYGNLLQTALDADTITEESLAEFAAERAAKDAVKAAERATWIPQWFDGHDWYEVVTAFPSNARVAHYYVRGYGNGDGSLCGVPYDGPRRASQSREADASLCNRCDKLIKVLPRP